jgi:beta-fructofuranosidase
MHRSSTKAGAHKPSYGAFLDVDVEKDKFISLRALVS